MYGWLRPSINHSKVKEKKNHVQIRTLQKINDPLHSQDLTADLKRCTVITNSNHISNSLQYINYVTRLKFKAANGPKAQSIVKLLCLCHSIPSTFTASMSYLSYHTIFCHDALLWPKSFSPSKEYIKCVNVRRSPSAGQITWNSIPQSN